VNADFAVDRNPYTDATIANYDLATMTASNSVATRDLIGAGVFFGTTGTNQAALNSVIALEYRLNGSYGTLSGQLTALDGSTARASFHAQSGMSGGGWVSGYRTLDSTHKYVIGVQSGETASGAASALLTPSMFYSIMDALAVGKSGSQSLQPTNYLHGSDDGEAMPGTFRPDIVYGNGGSDTINDGDLGKTYWANDRLFGGPWDDVLLAGRGSDFIHGGDVSTASGASVNLSADGRDVVDYSQFAGPKGIEINVGSPALSTLYQSAPNFDRAIFVKDLNNTSEIDTLLSVETIRGSHQADSIKLNSIDTKFLPGPGNQGGLVYIDLGINKSEGEVDSIDLSELIGSFVFNLGDASIFASSPDWQYE
jgi:hypothetical protein